MLHGIPIAVATDSYKAAHYAQYPPTKKMVAYGEFRTPFHGDKQDNRLVFFGIRYIVENYLHRRWTENDVEMAASFYQTHNAGFTQYPYPKDLFLKFIRENDGYFPVRLEALPDATPCNIHTPVYQITAEGEYSRLVTFLETVLTQVWYPSAVATLSRRTKELVEEAFEKSVDGGKKNPLVNSRLHDFGFRGCTCVEQSIIGGCAHLLNFEGTDTMTAAYYAQYHLNKGKPVASSIPATEHSVMTSWRSEKEAIENMIDHFGSGVYSIVMDSYDYVNALEKVLPSIKTKKLEKGGVMVLRPDSGEPVDMVLRGLRACEQVFGVEVNSKGYKVLKGAAVIQGDGINYDVVKRILEKTEEEKFSAQNVAFGMGGGLLQKVNRDTLGFATKLSHLVYEDPKMGARDIMKKPKSDSGKISLPGILRVKLEEGVPTVYPDEGGVSAGKEDNLLKIVYDKKPVNFPWDDFDSMRKRVDEGWAKLPQVGDPISAPLKTKNC
eukprot:TRINITY_DN5015_c0_g1_i3.p1 TRINITY_DN5015_c0_g1~~TRINITY_DN5015_c0_g1_i3.p1  ORF type:complete len:494 (-),score=144.05 TRINITY_DN5015_c0_g1_i3:37-1518(-)